MPKVDLSKKVCIKCMASFDEKGYWFEYPEEEFLEPPDENRYRLVKDSVPRGICKFCINK